MKSHVLFLFNELIKFNKWNTEIQIRLSFLNQVNFDTNSANIFSKTKRGTPSIKTYFVENFTTSHLNRWYG